MVLTSDDVITDDMYRVIKQRMEYHGIDPTDKDNVLDVLADVALKVMEDA